MEKIMEDYHLDEDAFVDFGVLPSSSHFMPETFGFVVFLVCW